MCCGILVLGLLFAAAAVAQEAGWETVTTNNMAMNSGWMQLSVADRDHVFVAGLHQDGALSVKYAWRTVNGGESWQPIYGIEMDGSDPCGMMDMMGFIIGVAFTDENHGILVGTGVPEECKELGMPLCFGCIFTMKAKVLYTFDGGETFQEAHVPADSNFVVLQTATFVTPEVGFAAGPPAFIIKTVDGGFDWVQVETPGGNENLGVNNLYFINPDEGWMATGDLDPEEPESATLNEAAQAQDPAAFRAAAYERYMYMKDPVTRLEYRMNHGGRGKGMNGILYHTTDGAISWEPIFNADQESYLQVQFTDSDHGWVVADPLAGTSDDYFTIYRTENGGQDWEKGDAPAEIPGLQLYTISAVYFTSPEVGWAVGAGQGTINYKTVILGTTDGGKTWQADPFTNDGGGRYPLLAVDFSDRKTGFAVGMYLSAARYLGLNSVPVADAGPDQTVKVGDVVHLDGSASYDEDQDPLQYIWAQPAGTPAALDDSTIMAPTFTATTVGTLTFELKVTDGEAISAPDQVNILVVKSGEDDDDDTSTDDDDAGDDNAAVEDVGGCGGCGMI
jgi:photosystem II stability/assembly factor-like uncharacterized protein